MTFFYSPAKLNLFLSVLGKRGDGYHNLASLFQAIDLMDVLSIEFAEKDCFTCSDPFLPLDQSNLVIKALHLFRRKSRQNFPVKIHLEKHIPSEAGLGGGSSNAATTLYALNKLAGNAYSESQLQEWSSEIGSDLAFFFSQGTAYCTGRGEIVQNMAGVQLGDFTIAKPKVGLSTPRVFAALDFAALHKNNPEQVLNSFYQGAPQFYNDLEGAALRVEPQLVHFKNRLLESGFIQANMTGSGTAFFCKGEGTPFPDAFFCKAKAIRRTPGSWYEKS